jgi:uncharacterized membrane protein
MDTLDKTMLFLHVLSAMVWTGGSIFICVLAVLNLRGPRDRVGEFVGRLRVIGPILLAPSVVILLGTGIYLVAEDDEIEVGDTWVVIVIALFAAAVLLGAAVLSRAAILAERAVEAGELDEARRRLTQWLWGMAAIAVMLVVATWDTTFRPGA